MSDLVLIKDIQRAVGVNVSDAQQVAAALARVRELLGQGVDSRSAPKGKDRLYVGGRDRSVDESA